MHSDRYDLILAGGGLAAGLIALALRRRRPELRVAVVEAGPVFGGDHIWSCFATDLGADETALVAPMVAWRWPVHEVRFPRYRREIPGAYQSLHSSRLHDALVAALPADCHFTNAAVAEVSADQVRLVDGRRLHGGAVIDARGARAGGALELGYQKFLGLGVELAAPHGLRGPIIMDATVEQPGAYRFVYVLPLGPTTLFIEDTYYADDATLDTQTLGQHIHAYAERRQWRIVGTGYRETGALPIAIGGDIERHLAAFPAGVPPVGMAAALFHPVTGYSLPDAARLALAIAARPEISARTLDPFIRGWAKKRWRERKFYRLLNRMLFHAALPEERWRVLQHFYALDPALVARFYAGHSNPADKFRILAGKPPVPVGRALAAMLKRERR